MPHLSTSQLIILLALSLVWGWLGYRLSEQARRTRGSTPWGMSSYLWAFFWFLSLLLGLVLYGIYLFTRSSSQPKPPEVWPQQSARPPGPVQSSTPPTSYSRGRPDPGSNFPAYPRPANSGPTSSGVGDGQSRPAPESDRRPPISLPLTPPDWHPDPSGRFDFRWWDGAQWTSQVSKDGRNLVDDDPDQRIGPY